MMNVFVTFYKPNGDKYPTSSIMNMSMIFIFIFIQAHEAKLFDVNSIIPLPF
jgi:hypothetical protein